MDMSKIDLNAPAFGQGAQKIDALEQEHTEETVVEPVEEVKKEEETETPSEEESKVPYSRFKKFHDRAREADRIEEELLKTKQELEEARRLRQPEFSPDGELPDFWIEMYGDSDASRKAWQIQERQNEKIRSEAREEAIKAITERKEEEENRVESNLEEIDEQFNDLSDKLGRELSDKEQSELLDIVDDYTPKDNKGNYLGALISFEKAWEILELKQKATKAPQKKERDSIASLTSTQSNGNSVVDIEKDKNWNPLDWNGWKKRL